MDEFLQQRILEEEVEGWEQGKDTAIFDYILNDLEIEHNQTDPDYKARLKRCVFGYGGLTPVRLLDAFKTRFEGKDYRCFPTPIVPAELEALCKNGSGKMRTTAFFNLFFDFFVDNIISV